MTRTEYNKTVDKHADGLYRFILKSMKDTDAAKDVVQDVFAKLWEKHSDVQFEKSKSYLFTAGYRTMIDYFRKDSRLTMMEGSHQEIQHHSEQYSDLKEILNQAVEKLPEVQKSAILLRDYEGYSYKEIGNILSLQESQVKVYIFRARKFLQNYLKSIETVI